jgi:anti-sigma regulatory factor (Ser/Thr protein kinase)
LFYSVGARSCRIGIRFAWVQRNDRNQDREGRIFMARGVLLSWLATDHDPFYSDRERGGKLVADGDAKPGPSLNLVTDPYWGPRFQVYILFHQAKEQAQVDALARAIQARRSDLLFLPTLLETFDVVNHGDILNRLTGALRGALQTYPYEPHPLERGSPLWDFAEQEGHYLKIPGWPYIDSDAMLPEVDQYANAAVWEETFRWQREHAHEYYICLSQGTPAMHAIWLVLLQAEIIKATLLQTIPARFRKAGESCAREVVLDLIGRLPSPVIRDLKRRGVQEREERRKQGSVAVLAHFICSNIYGTDSSYGTYRLTHHSSREQVGETLKRIDEDVNDLVGYLQPEGMDRVRRFVEGARGAFDQGEKAFRDWVGDNAEDYKSAFRFNVKDWVADVQQDREHELRLEVQVDEDTEYLFSQDLFCEADVVRSGLDNILQNAICHGYKDRPGPNPMKLRVRLEPETADAVAGLRLELTDHGRGFAQVAQHFRKPSGSAGCGMAAIRSLRHWFRLEVRSVYREVYQVNEDRDEKAQPAPGTGVTFVLTYAVPRTQESKPCPLS